jgi:hypothetical protein
MRTRLARFSRILEFLHTEGYCPCHIAVLEHTLLLKEPVRMSGSIRAFMDLQATSEPWFSTAIQRIHDYLTGLDLVRIGIYCVPVFSSHIHHYPTQLILPI